MSIYRHNVTKLPLPPQKQREKNSNSGVPTLNGLGNCSIKHLERVGKG